MEPGPSSSNFTISDIIQNTLERRKICAALHMNVHDPNLDFVDYKLKRSPESPNKFYIRNVSGKYVYYCDYEDATKSHRLYDAHQILIERQRLEMMGDLLVQYGYKISDATSIDYDVVDDKFYLFDPDCNGMVKWASIKFTKSKDPIDQDYVCWVTHNASNSGPGMYAHTFFKHAVFMGSLDPCIRYIFAGLILRSPMFVAGNHQRNQENIIVTHIEATRMYTITRASSQGTKTYSYREYRGTLSSRVDESPKLRVTETQDINPNEFSNFPHRDDVFKTVFEEFKSLVESKIKTSIEKKFYVVYITVCDHHNNAVLIDWLKQLCAARKFTIKDIVYNKTIEFSVI